MTNDTTHKWHFDFTEDAKSAYDNLRPGHKRGVLNCLRQTLRTENPRAGDPACLTTLQGEEYKHILKYRVGSYRVLIMKDETEIEVNDHTYKGTIIVVEIDHRKDIYNP